MAVVKAKEIIEGDVIEIAGDSVIVRTIVVHNKKVYIVGRTLESRRLARWETDEETVVLIFYTIID